MNVLFGNMVPYIICGSPRSGTTWLHNVLLESGFFRGIKASDVEYKRYDSIQLYTDEHYPLMDCSIRYAAEASTKRKDFYLNKTSTIITQFISRYGVDNRLMIESPYYVFSLQTFYELFGNNLKVIFIMRNAQDVSSSMAEHIHIRRLLKQRLNKSFDFYQNSFLRRNSIEAKYIHHDVYRFVQKNYSVLSTVERALIKWHYFNRAYHVNSKWLNGSNSLILDYDNFGKDPILNKKLQSFLGMDNRLISCILKNFHPKQREKIKLTRKGEMLLELIKEKTDIL